MRSERPGITGEVAPNVVTGLEGQVKSLHGGRVIASAGIVGVEECTVADAFCVKVPLVLVRSLMAVESHVPRFPLSGPVLASAEVSAEAWAPMSMMKLRCELRCSLGCGLPSILGKLA
jgi:hypothetical protein